MDNIKKTVGIVGGMGPLATCDLMKKIILCTGAETDQDNIHMVVDCNTNIPDRTAAILSGAESPVPQLVRSSVKLQGMGADVLIMPCNTAHYFYDDIAPFIDIPMLHMIRETAKTLKEKKIEKAGLLATTGTIRTDIYRRELEKQGIMEICPDEEQQKAVMGLIYDGVKASDPHYDTAAFSEVVQSLQERGAQTLILGCTELPVAMELYHMEFPSVDPTAVLAQAAVDFCMKG